jgi:hypothetical protein
MRLSGYIRLLAEPKLGLVHWISSKRHSLSGTADVYGRTAPRTYSRAFNGGETIGSPRRGSWA